MNSIVNKFPRQSLSYRAKTKEWRKDCIKFADSNTMLSSSSVRKTIAHKKLNYDLYNGIIHMEDIEALLNPGIDLKMPSKPIQHYPIMNSQLRLLIGEERALPFEYRVVVTNPNALSEIEETKKKEVLQRLENLVQQELSEEEQQKQLEKLQKYYNYDYQDIREIRANCLLNHYKKVQNFDGIFNDGFVDVTINNEEIYQCSIESGVPVLRRLNPLKVRAYGMGSSNYIEDADMVVLEDYWQTGRIIDTWYNKLSIEEIKKLESLDTLKGGNESDWGDRGDPRWAFRFGNWGQGIKSDEYGDLIFDDGVTGSNLPFDMEGNIRVLQVYWKSLRKIKEIKRYDPETGEPETVFRTEDYKANKDLGEEETVHFINEAWHGVMIGAGEDAIYIDMGPCQVQYNTMSNPSKCHFGIVGTIYSVNEAAPYSLVDMLKPLSYMYDVTKARLNRLMDRNLGKIVVFNESMMPDWTPEKTIHYLKNGGFTIVNPMKEGTIGAAIGKLAGNFNNISPVLDLELGNSIQNMMQFLQFTENEMRTITGITEQRMGAIQNRETLGGVERSNVQSSHVTRWFFSKHADTKKRVLNCFLETAKIALRGKKETFKYILSDGSQTLMDIDGDLFAENDYGLVVDDDYDTQDLNQSINQIAQAAMQNQTLLFSTFLKIKSNCSMAEKIKMIEADEQRMQEQMQQQQQQQAQLQQQAEQMKMQQEQAKMQMEYQMNTEDNETKILVAQIQAQNQQELATINNEGNVESTGNLNRDKLNEDIRQFNAKLDLDNRRLEYEQLKHKQDLDTKLQIAKMKPKNTDK